MTFAPLMFFGSQDAGALPTGSQPVWPPIDAQIRDPFREAAISELAKTALAPQAPPPAAPLQPLFIPASDPGAGYAAAAALGGAYVDPNSLDQYFPQAPKLEQLSIDPRIFDAVNARLDKAAPTAPKPSSLEDRALAAAMALGLGYFGARGNRLYGGRAPVQALGLGLSQGLGASEGLKSRDRAEAQRFAQAQQAYEAQRAASELQQQTFLLGREDRNVGTRNQGTLLDYQRGTSLGNLKAQTVAANAREGAAAARSRAALLAQAQQLRAPSISLSDGTALVRQWDPARGGWTISSNVYDPAAAKLAALEATARVQKLLGEATGGAKLPQTLAGAETAGLGPLERAVVQATNEAKVRGSADWQDAYAVATSQINQQLTANPMAALMKENDKQKLIENMAEDLLRQTFLSRPEMLSPYTAGQQLMRQVELQQQASGALGGK